MFNRTIRSIEGKPVQIIRFERLNGHGTSLDEFKGKDILKVTFFCDGSVNITLYPIDKRHLIIDRGFPYLYPINGNGTPSIDLFPTYWVNNGRIPGKIVYCDMSTLGPVGEDENPLLKGFEFVESTLVQFRNSYEGNKNTWGIQIQ